MKKQTKIKIIFASIALIVVVLVIVGIAIENTKDINAIESVAKANVSATNEEIDPEVEAIMQLDASGDKVPVPEGYVGSKATGENEIDTGYVIYEGTEEVNDSNVEQAKTKRNQYVWIPVPDASKMYGTDSNGKKWGKLYNFATSSTNSNYDELTGAYPLNWSETNGIISISSTGYREPDVVIDYDIDSKLKTLGLGADTTHEFLIQLEEEFNNMIESVKKYGGFYIGRYETGNLSQDTAVVQKGNTDNLNGSWYRMYKECKTLKGSNNKIETGMIWGNQWDRTLMWLVESGNKTKEEITEDSTGWGNYANATFEYENSSGSIVTKEKDHSIDIPTGSTEYTNANNIYDLAGNLGEITMESQYNRGRVYRGGRYVSVENGNRNPVKSRYGLSSSFGNFLRMSSNTLHQVALKTW